MAPAIAAMLALAGCGDNASQNARTQDHQEAAALPQSLRLGEMTIRYPNGWTADIPRDGTVRLTFQPGNSLTFWFSETDEELRQALASSTSEVTDSLKGMLADEAQYYGWEVDGEIGASVRDGVLRVSATFTNGMVRAVWFTQEAGYSVSPSVKDGSISAFPNYRDQVSDVVNSVTFNSGD